MHQNNKKFEPNKVVFKTHLNKKRDSPKTSIQSVSKDSIRFSFEKQYFDYNTLVNGI